MKPSKTLVIGLLAGLAFAMPGTLRAGQGIVGSPHDFSANTNFFYIAGTNFFPNNNICEVCHTIHKAPAAYKSAGPLWAHNLSANTFTPYKSAQLTADGLPNGGTPGWSSLACLSCHDGSVAINQFNAKSTPTGSAVNMSAVASWANIAPGGDLSGVHPIGIPYDTVQAIDPGLKPSSTPITDALTDTGTIAKELLFNENGVNTLECASCHDIHQVKGASSVAKDSLKIGADGVGSTLCTTCHVK